MKIKKPTRVFKMNSPKSYTEEIHQTLPSLLVRNARRFGDSRVALREKEYGIWQSVTWQQYLEHVRDFSLGLISLGFSPGDTLGIIGNNRPEWVYAELAAQAARGVPFGIFQDSILSEVAYIIDHAEATMIVAEDQEQVDKILDLKEKLPRVKKIIRSISLEEAREIADQAMRLPVAHEVESFVRGEMVRRFPNDITPDGRQICLI